MFGRLRKREKINVLQNSIDKLSQILEKSNIHEYLYILGSKKEIIKRNFLAGISRGIGTRNRIYNNNSSYNIFFAKNSKTQHSCSRKIFK